MSQWFYAEGNRQQRGPLSSDELAALYHSSRIALDTLVWRDGMAQWLPLSAVSAEIGLDTTASIIPAVDAGMAAPPMPPALPEPAAADPSRVPPAASVPPAYTMPPPKQGLSGCAIAGIIGAVALVLLVAIGAILAAIAMPAYQQYVTRAQASAAFSELAPIKADVAGFVQEHGRCPVNDDEGFEAPEGYASTNLGAVRIGRFDNGHCGVEAELALPESQALGGKLLWLDYDGEQQRWECSGEPDDKYLPADCRG